MFTHGLKSAALAAAVMVAAAPVAQPAFAQTAKSGADSVATTTATAKAKAAEMIKTSDEAFQALRDVRAARLAIFNGLADDAAKLVADAVKELDMARKTAADFAVPTKKGASTGDVYVPFDAGMVLAEDFVATPEKTAAIKKANEHIAKGEAKKAAEVLKLANVDVTLAAAVLPIDKAVKHIHDAERLIGEHKYYEANLALKAIEDSVVIENYGMDVIPTQGKK